jgi:hypothetical protein
MQKKKGYILLFTIITFLFLITLSISILTLTTCTIMTNSAYEKIEKVKLTAESGIEKGLALANQQNSGSPETNTVEIIFNNIKTKLSNEDNFNFSMYDNLIDCTVKFSYDKCKEIIVINSTAVTKDCKYKKTIEATLQKDAAELILQSYVISAIGCRNSA